ncbi:MAG: tetratricopeptide repeat protein [Hyphomicrobiales bacterium]|nr:tetratricopeptide repeat protein [Hyphomicrobiales bacterium]
MTRIVSGVIAVILVGNGGKMYQVGHVQCGLVGRFLRKKALWLAGGVVLYSMGVAAATNNPYYPDYGYPSVTSSPPISIRPDSQSSTIMRMYNFNRPKVMMPEGPDFSTDSFNERSLDNNYQAFMESVSMLLHSLSDKQLSVETRQYLASIPAGKLQAITRALAPKNGATIVRGDAVELFGDDEYADTDYDDEVNGLKIEIGDNEDTTAKQLRTGRDALVSGQSEGATTIYKTVLAKEPENKQALFGLAASYHKRQQYAQAREYYLKVLEKDNQFWPAINNMLMLAREEGKDEALTLLQKLEMSNAEFAPLPAQIGMVYIEKGELENAAKYLSRAVTLAPENTHYRYNLAVVLDQMGNHTQAARLYQQLLAANLDGMELPEQPERIQDRLTYLQSQVAGG